MNDTAPIRLLLVDDEAALREPLAEYLSRQGFAVTYLLVWQSLNGRFPVFPTSDEPRSLSRYSTSASSRRRGASEASPARPRNQWRLGLFPLTAQH